MLKNYSLVKEILGGAWAIEPGIAQSLLPVVGSILFPDKFSNSNYHEVINQGSTDRIPARSLAFSVDEFGNQVQFDPQKGYMSPATPSVMVLSMKDVVVKYDQACGPMGTETLAANIRKAGDDKNVVAIILDIDSGGGSAGATKNPYEAILEARKKKPVLAYVGNGMAASAAYYIASASEEIYASYITDTIGSIGTMVTLADWAGWYEQNGIKLHEIYATKSTEKNREYRDAIDGDYKGIVESWLDPFNENFHADVVAARGSKLNQKEVLTGKLFFAEEALKNGLIDGMMSMKEVISRAWELASEKRTNSNKDTEMFNKYPKTTVLARNKSNGTENSAEQIAEAQAEVLEMTGMHLNARSEAEIAQRANEELADQLRVSNETIAERDATIAQLQTQVQELSERAVDHAASASSASAEGGAAEAKEEGFNDAEYASRRMNELGL